MKNTQQQHQQNSKGCHHEKFAHQILYKGLVPNGKMKRKW